MSKKISVLTAIKMFIVLDYMNMGKEPPTDKKIEDAVKKVAKKNPQLLYALVDKNYDGKKDVLGPAMKAIHKNLT